jgi:AcrR family transcriptional regulator
MKLKRDKLSGRRNGQARPGRPRSFDEERALDQALKVFWRKGYEGTSLDDLTGAMGINRPSLYATFGNKEALFRKALDRYEQGPGGFTAAALAEPTARRVIERLLRAAADALTDRHHPRGCLMVQGALSCGQAADSIRRELASRRAAGEASLRVRFQRAQREGDLPQGAVCADLARYVTTVIQGMAVQAAGGATRMELQRVAEMSLEALADRRRD